MPLPTDQRQRQKIIDYNAIANRKDAISDNALKQPLKKSICFLVGPTYVPTYPLLVFVSSKESFCMKTFAI